MTQDAFDFYGRLIMLGLIGSLGIAVIVATIRFVVWVLLFFWGRD